MISRSELKAVKDDIRSNKICNGVGYKIKRTATGTTLEIKPGKGGGSSEVYPFQCIYPSPYTGAGDPPTNQALKFRVRPGIFKGPDNINRFASNKNAEFTAPDDNSDGFYLWAKLTLVTDSDGNVSFTAFLYESGVTLPTAEEGNTTTGSPPSNVFLPLFYVTTTDGKIDLTVPLVRNSQQIKLEVGDITCLTKVRNISFQAI